MSLSNTPQAHIRPDPALSPGGDGMVYWWAIPITSDASGAENEEIVRAADKASRMVRRGRPW